MKNLGNLVQRDTNKAPTFKSPHDLSGLVMNYSALNEMTVITRDGKVVKWYDQGGMPFPRIHVWLYLYLRFCIVRLSRYLLSKLT